MNTRIAIYGRVSTKDKGQDSENQLRQLREFALQWKYVIVAEFIDNLSASGKVVRPEFNLMMEQARQRKFDLVLFWSLDRLSREGVSETLGYLNNLTVWGVGWKSYSEQYLDSTGIFKEAVIAILATVAKQERVRIGERVKAGMETAKAKGVKFGRKSVLEAGRLRKGRKAPTVSLEQIIKLKGEGKSLRQIQTEVGVSKDSIARLLLSQKPSVRAVC